MLNCKETTRLLSESQDRPLTLIEKINLRLHLYFCDGCTRYKSHLNNIRHFLNHYFSK